MYHYLFTNDLRISHLEDSLVEAGECFKDGCVPSANEDKNANNNMNTLGFYFNLTQTSECAVECANKNVRTVVLNFIKKFQFPNPRTKESFEGAVADGIQIAPMRIILRLLYMMNMQGVSDTYLTKSEIADFIFFNAAVAKTNKIDYLAIIKQIEEYRLTGAFPTSVEKDESNRQWKQETRQIREMVKVLTWSGCVVEGTDGNIRLESDSLTKSNKADLFDILTYEDFWSPVGKNFNDIKSSYQEYMDIQEIDIVNNKNIDGNLLTPEWFNENGKAFAYLDEEAEKERQAFLQKYNPDILKTLEGMTLLRTVFLNDDNKDNLCYELEFNSKLIEIFGSIKSGTAYKYGLHYSKKNQSWATGSGRKPQFLTADEAVELGTEIRDYLVVGAEVLRKYDSIDTLEDYKKLFKELNEATDGYGTRVWFLKYYQMLSPELFPPIYSKSAQETVLNAIGVIPDDNTVIRMGQMQLFIKKCEVSPIVFSRTFWTNYDADSMDEETEAEESENPIKYETKYESSFSRNRILFGAPGTGKSFTINNDAKELIGKENEDDYERVTFHPDYSYANFVGTYKPVPTIDNDGKDAITYEYVPGPFMRVYVKALKNSRTDNIKPFLLIIEEINRANVAAVFGDVFQLLDRGDNFVSEYSIQATEDIKKYLTKELGGNPDDYNKIKIPDNMFIWATMNSADQGVFPMDTAFKRRWDFTYLGIDDNDQDLQGKYVYLADDKSQKVEWNKLRKAINNFLAKEKINEDKQLGPYFISRSIVVPNDSEEIDRDRFINTFKNKVIMYLFEDAAKQKRPRLFEGCFQNSSRYSEICREFEAKGVGIFNHDIQLDCEVEDVKSGEVTQE